MLPINQPIPFSHDGLLWLHFNLTDSRALQWLASANSSGLSRIGDAAVFGVTTTLRY